MRRVCAGPSVEAARDHGQIKIGRTHDSFEDAAAAPIHSRECCSIWPSKDETQPAAPAVCAGSHPGESRTRTAASSWCMPRTAAATRGSTSGRRARCSGRKSSVAHQVRRRLNTQSGPLHRAGSLDSLSLACDAPCRVTLLLDIIAQECLRGKGCINALRIFFLRDGHRV